VIMDDWYGFPSRTAVEDFFRVHDMEEEIKRIDTFAAYWKKTKDVKVQFWRYKLSNFRV
jgi:hypothetical protein